MDFGDRHLTFFDVCADLLTCEVNQKNSYHQRLAASFNWNRNGGKLLHVGNSEVLNLGRIGGAEGVRTPDLLDAIEARSQLRHGPTDGNT